jgi:hypothetical protein
MSWRAKVRRTEDLFLGARPQKADCYLERREPSVCASLAVGGNCKGSSRLSRKNRR